MNSSQSGRIYDLTAWQKKQAAMLYHYSSEEYLRKLHRMVYDLVNGVVEPLLDLAKAQGRDRVLSNSVWGDRDTVENWSNNGWPILKDLQLSLAHTLARRATNHFQVSAVNESLRWIREFSMNWTTPGEERMFEMALRSISEYGSMWDRTVLDYQNSWNDYRLAYNYPAFAEANHRIPKFQVRDDSRAFTGQIPPRTGVYFSPDEPNASLQFAWAEHGGVKLRLANTFNELGLAAQAAVGRDALWFDEEKMLQFVMSAPLAESIRDEALSDGKPCAFLAPSAVGRSAFITKSCSWMLVEPIPGEFEDLGSLSNPSQQRAPETRKFLAGQECTEAGFYFTPSSPNSRRHFAKGEHMPSANSGYGETIWQWDADQGS